MFNVCFMCGQGASPASPASPSARRCPFVGHVPKHFFSGRPQRGGRRARAQDSTAQPAQPGAAKVWPRCAAKVCGQGAAKVRPRCGQGAAKVCGQGVRPRCGQGAAKVRPRCGQGRRASSVAAKVRPRCGQGVRPRCAAKVRRRCGEGAAKLRPSCGQVAAKLRPSCGHVAANGLLSRVTSEVWPVNRFVVQCACMLFSNVQCFVFGAWCQYCCDFCRGIVLWFVAQSCVGALCDHLLLCCTGFANVLRLLDFLCCENCRRMC